MKIARYGAYDDIDVEFLDDFHFIKTTTYSNFIRGQVKNPYDRDLFGIGYIGVGKWKVKHNDKWSRVYLCWRHMIERCYHKKSSKQYPAYYGICTVCDEWLCYQNFAEWYENNKYEVKGRLHLDKDILYPGNKIYEPNKCLLVPQRINMLFVNKPNQRNLPNGIDKLNKGYSARYSGKDLGSFDTIEKAYKAYSQKKKEEIVRIADEYKSIIPQKVYDALLRYEFDIHNDRNYLIFGGI